MQDSIIKAIEYKKGYSVKIIDIKTNNEPFKFIHYGRKKFFKHKITILNENNDKESFSIIEKQLPDIDVAMLFSRDYYHRELEFLASDLKKSFERFFVIPAIYIDKDSKSIFMEDCVEDLKMFGPPVLPAFDQMKALITRIAIKDARFQKYTFKYAREYLSSFHIINKMFNNTLSENERELISNDWPWFLPGSKKLIKQLGQVRFEKWKSLYDIKRVEKIFANIPYTLHHGDFYFANIGFNNLAKPVVLDWESVAWAPIGLDFVTLTYGIPPLAFTDKYEEWYISAYNNACDEPISMKDFLYTTDLIRKYYFLVADTIDAIRFSFHNESNISLSEQNTRINHYIKRLDLYIKTPKKISRLSELITAMEM